MSGAKSKELDVEEQDRSGALAKERGVVEGA